MVAASLLAACGARSALFDPDDGTAGAGGGSSTSTSASTTGMTTGGGVTCAPQVLGLDGRGAVRLELLGDTLVYSSVSGNLVRADLGPVGGSTPISEKVIARGLAQSGDIAVTGGFVYYASQADFGFVVRRVPLDGGLEQDVYYPAGTPAWIEVDASAIYVADSSTFTGLVVRMSLDGSSLSTLAENLGQAYPIALAGDLLLGFASTLPGSTAVDHLYSMPKLGGPLTVVAVDRFGADYARMIDGRLYWYQPSFVTSGTNDLFAYDPASGAIATLKALPEYPIAFAEDADRIYVTTVTDAQELSNRIFALGRDGAVLGTFVDDHAEQFPTEIRAGGGRVAWTVQRDPGSEIDVPSVRIECTAAFR